MARQDDDQDPNVNDPEDDEEVEDDNSSGGASGDGDDDEDEYTPPSREEWERVQRTLQRRQQEKRTLRRKLREKETGGNGSTGSTGSGPSADDIRREMRAESDARLVRTEARSALSSAGLVDTSPAAIKRAVRLLDLEDVEVDEDGEVDGLEDAIADLKASMPSLFKKGKKAPAGKVTTGSRGSSGGTGGKPKTATQKLLEQLNG